MSQGETSKTIHRDAPKALQTRIRGMAIASCIVGVLCLLFCTKMLEDYNLHHIPRRMVTYGQNADPALPIKEVPFKSGYLSYVTKEPLKLKCTTCAYVTGSGHLTGSGKGKEIDSMSCVIRSNAAPTTGYAADVGRKTTARTVDRNSLNTLTTMTLHDHGAFDPFINSTKIIAYNYPIDLIFPQMNKSHSIFPQWDLYYVTPERFNEIHAIFSSQVSGSRVWASNGFISVYIARDFCDEIHVYGIDEASFCEHVRAENVSVADIPYHYFDATWKNCDLIDYLNGGKANTHHFTKEKRYFKKLLQQWHNLYFHAPEWPK